MPFIMSAWDRKGRPHHDPHLRHTVGLLAAAALPALCRGTPYIFGECAWNEFGTHCFGIPGYLLLGHLLKNNGLSTPKVVLLLALLLFIGICHNLHRFRSMSAQYS